MRRPHAVFAGVLLTVLEPVAAVAHADEPGQAPAKSPDRIRWALTLNTGEPLVWREDGGGPDFVDEEVENTAEISASWGVFKAKYSYLKTMKGNGEGFGVAVKDNCPGLKGVKCSVGVSFKETLGNSTVRYDAGVSGSLRFLMGVRPDWSVTAIHNDSQEGSDTLISTDLKAPIRLFNDNKIALNLKGGGSYSFQQKQLKPTWGVGIEYRPDGPGGPMTITLGYGGTSSLSENEQLDVKHKVMASIDMKL